MIWEIKRHPWNPDRSDEVDYLGLINSIVSRVCTKNVRIQVQRREKNCGGSLKMRCQSYWTQKVQNVNKRPCPMHIISSDQCHRSKLSSDAFSWHALTLHWYLVPIDMKITIHAPPWAPLTKNFHPIPGPSGLLKLFHFFPLLEDSPSHFNGIDPMDPILFRPKFPAEAESLRAPWLTQSSFPPWKSVHGNHFWGPAENENSFTTPVSVLAIMNEYITSFIIIFTYKNTNPHVHA